MWCSILTTSVTNTEILYSLRVKLWWNCCGLGQTQIPIVSYCLWFSCNLWIGHFSCQMSAFTFVIVHQTTWCSVSQVKVQVKPRTYQLDYKHLYSEFSRHSHVFDWLLYKLHSLSCTSLFHTDRSVDLQSYIVHMNIWTCSTHTVKLLKMAGSPLEDTRVFLFRILIMFVFHSSLSPCAAELEVGAKDI